MSLETRFFLSVSFSPKTHGSNVFRFTTNERGFPSCEFFSTHDKTWKPSESLERDIYLGSGGFEEVSEEFARNHCPEAFM